MGIGRRDFLKFAGVALAGIVVDPLRAIAVHKNYYVNMRLGLGFEKPDGWRFESFKDFAALLKGQVVEGIAPEGERQRSPETGGLPPHVPEGSIVLWISNGIR